MAKELRAGKHTINAILQEMKREHLMKKKMYPTWVAQGKLDKDVANRRIEQSGLSILIFEESLEKGTLRIPTSGEVTVDITNSQTQLSLTY